MLFVMTYHGYDQLETKECRLEISPSKHKSLTVEGVLARELGLLLGESAKLLVSIAEPIRPCKL